MQCIIMSKKKKKKTVAVPNRKDSLMVNSLSNLFNKIFISLRRLSVSVLRTCSFIMLDLLLTQNLPVRFSLQCLFES